MATIVSLDAHRPRPQPSGLLARHLACFAQQRRARGDVFWLKENAELLNILRSAGVVLRHGALEPYAEIYDNMLENMRIFPQYYRFWVSICLDLEDLGFRADHGETLCHWADRQGLPRAELSDLQRAEAEYLLARRGIGTRDPGLRDRLRDFVRRAGTFAIPNRKAAYELTHILFYLSDYGQQDPNLPEAETALDYAGTLALLDQNFDLLAEVCVARAYAGLPVNETWDRAVKTALKGFRATPCDTGPTDDAYHAYFVQNWWAEMSGGQSFACDPGLGAAWFAAPPIKARPVAELSGILRDMPGADWQRSAPLVQKFLSDDSWHILLTAKSAARDWDRFFALFSRALPTGPSDGKRRAAAAT